MTKDEDFKLLKIQTCVLRVNIHCDGCKQKVKKLLHRIEGVYQVNIDAEQQKVTVSGGVDSATLIKKLVRAGKHAEPWSRKTNQNQKQKANCIKDDKNNKAQKQHCLIKGLEALKNQQKFPFSLEEEDDFLDDDVDEYDEEDELRFIREKANQPNLLRQQAIEGNNGKKDFVAMAAASNNGKLNNNGGNANAGKKGNPNQNVGMKGNPGGMDQKTMAALKMNNASAQLGAANMLHGEGKLGNDINSMMNLGGFHGNGSNNNLAAVLGGNSTTPGGYLVQTNNGLTGSSGGYPTGVMATGGHHPTSMMLNMNGYQQYNHPSSSSSMLMNLQNRHAMQQPQMMYNRSPFIPTSTGYYYNNGPVPYTCSDQSYSNGPYHHHNHHDQSAAAAHMFSDENTSSCSIM